MSSNVRLQGWRWGSHGNTCMGSNNSNAETYKEMNWFGTAVVREELTSYMT